MSFILLAIAAILISVSQILNKKLALKGHRASTYTVVIMLASALVSFPFLFYRFQISESPLTWILTVFSVVSYALSFAFVIKAYKETDVSAVSIVQRLSLVIVAGLAIIFLKETYTLKSYVGLFFIVLSGVMIVYEKRRLTFTQGIIYALLGTFFSALSSVLDKHILREFSPYTYLFINNLLVGLVFSLRGHIIHDAPILIKKNYKSIIITAFFMTLSFLLILIVLKNTQVSWAIPTYKGLSLIFPVLLGIFFLNEKQKITQKIFGTLLGVLGIILLYQ